MSKRKMKRCSSLSRFFSVELENKEYVSKLIISNEKRNKVLITGDLGQLVKIELLDEMVLEFQFTNGRVRLDINLDETFAFLCKIFT